jgi:LCP family protein required for cell wall assembly
VLGRSAGSTLPPELDPRGPAPRRRRRSPALRLVNLVAATLSVVVLIASVGGYVVVQWFDGSIARVHLSLGVNRPADAPQGEQNWLLVGTDSRAGTDGEYGTVDGQRSDTTILTHLDSDGTTTNVSFPRDVLVTIPEYTDSKGTTHPSHKAKFNEAISDGGASLLVRTVEALTGIRIDHYVSVDLEGFKRISQAVNGVQVCILHSDFSETSTENGISHTSSNINDSYSGFVGHDGEQTVAGDSALAFVRQRHGLVNGDLGRIQRQQQFLGSVFRQATASNVLFNPVRVAKLLAAIKDALTLDQDTSLVDLEKLGLRLRGLDPSKVSFETVPNNGLQQTDSNLGDVFTDSQGFLEIIPSGQSESVGNVQIIDQAAFTAMINKLKGASATPSPRTSAKPATKPVTVTIPPSQVLVTVQNGIGRNGLASSVTTTLGGDGFRTGAPGPADRTDYAKSEVHYAPGSEDSANTVAAAIPGSVLKEDASVTNGIVLIVGANFTSVQPVEVGLATPTATPTPTASASPTAPPVTAANNRCTF